MWTEMNSKRFVYFIKTHQVPQLRWSLTSLVLVQVLVYKQSLKRIFCHPSTYPFRIHKRRNPFYCK